MVLTVLKNNMTPIKRNKQRRKQEQAGTHIKQTTQSKHEQ